MSATMEDNPLQAIMYHVKLALSAAESSCKQVSSWQQRASAAEATLLKWQLRYSEKSDELHACQQHCETLKEELASVNDQLTTAHSAKEESSKHAAASDLQLVEAAAGLEQLREQLQTAVREHQEQCSNLQDQIQHLQLELMTAHNSKDLLLQQLQQQEAQLQELLESAATKAAVSADCDDELPSTQYDDSQADPSQQQVQQQQELATLKAQLCQLLNDNAVLQVRNESLDQQLAASRLQLAQLQQQSATAAVQSHQQHDGQQQLCRQQVDQHADDQGKVSHDKAYYKRKYIDMKAKYDALKQQARRSCASCGHMQGNSNQQHSSGKSRLAGMKRQYNAEVLGLIDSALQQQHAQQAARQSSITASRGLQGQTESAAVAPAAVTSLHAEQGTPSKPVLRCTQTAAGQSSPATAAAAARLAAAFSPLSQHKKRKSKAACNTAADKQGSAGSPVAPTAAVISSTDVTPSLQAANRGVSAPSAPQVDVTHSALTAPVQQQVSEAAAGGVVDAVTTDITVQQRQQQQQRCNSDNCEPTLLCAPGTDGTQDTVDLYLTDKHQLLAQQGAQQQDQQREQHLLQDRPAGLGQDVLDQRHTNDNADKDGIRQVSSKQQQPRTTASGSGKQEQQQQQLGKFSPAWRAARGHRKAVVGNSAAVGKSQLTGGGRSSRTNSNEQGSLPKAGSLHQAADCDSLLAGDATATASAAGGTSGAADCDSDFDSPPKPKVRSKHRGQQQQQQKLLRTDQSRVSARQQVSAADDLSELSDVDEQQGQQHRAGSKYGGRQRSITPSVQNPLQSLPAAEQPEQQTAGQQPMQQLRTAAAAAAMMPSRYSVVCSKPVGKQQPQSSAVHVSITSKPQTDSAPSMQTAGSNGQQTVADAAAPCAVDAGGFKYQEVVRGKSARELLPAFECEECRKFYSALQSWGPAGQSAMPVCGHAAPKPKQGAQQAAGPQAAEGATGHNGRPQQSMQLPAVVHDVMQNAGRHRAKWRPPSTPPGFWHIGFTPDHDMLEVKQG